VVWGTRERVVRERESEGERVVCVWERERELGGVETRRNDAPFILSCRKEEDLIALRAAGNGPASLMNISLKPPLRLYTQHWCRTNLLGLVPHVMYVRALFFFLYDVEGGEVERKERFCCTAVTFKRLLKNMYNVLGLVLLLKKMLHSLSFLIFRNLHLFPTNWNWTF